MAMYRCYSLKCAGPDGESPPHEFEAAKPVCPACGLDGTQPKYANFVRAVTAIHLDPPDGLVPGVGKGVALCDGWPVGKLWHRDKSQATGNPDCVTCRRCRDHAEFPVKWDEASGVPAWSVGVELKPVPAG